MRSLSLKLIIAFVAVSLTGTALLAVSVDRVNTAEFSSYVTEQMRSDFATVATQFYETTGSWAGAAQQLAWSERAGPPPPDAAPYPTPAAGFVLPRAGGLFAVADINGVVVVPGGPYHTGERVPPEDLAKGLTVESGGSAVGTVISPIQTRTRNPREDAYLEKTNRMLIFSALGATLVALVLGILLARSLTRPLREMTAATRALAQGDLHQQVTVRSRDELGELAAAFNQMSADLSRANRLRRQMTADIAHELRTPLTVLTGYLESLRDGVLKATPARYDVMHREAQHLHRLVEDLRLLSLADAGELKLNRQDTAPREILDRAFSAFAHRAEQGGRALRVESPDGLPAVQVDPERMAQVLNNLITNSLRYTPAGGQVTLSAGRRDGEVTLTVHDCGAGIAPDVLPHVFERFYRGDPARQQQEDESGLGLAISKSLVEAHGGRISVESILGEGATFTIHLPVGHGGSSAV
jgi:signal transduction histidine kinase